MAITWQNVVNVAPATAGLPVAAQAEILAIADREVNADAWGARRDDGMKFLAAHLATLWLTSGRGMVTSESVGPLSRSYATPLQVMGSLALSSYGAEYERLIYLLPTALGGVP